MKKLFINFIFLILIFFIVLISLLSTVGIKTNKFNNFITFKISEIKNINLELNFIKFKIDLKELSLFLETKDPQINYRNLNVPVQNIKVYVDFPSLLKSDLKIKKLNLTLKELDITELNKLSPIFKPSNFKSLINNKINEGLLMSQIDIFLDDKGSIKDFIAKGNIKDLKVEIIKGLNLENTSLSFFADKNDILVKNIFGRLENIRISEGDLRLNLEKGVKLNSNFKSKIKFDKKFPSKFFEIFKKYELAGLIESLEGEFNNNIFFDLDKTYKVIDYNYNFSAKIKKTNLKLLNPIKKEITSQKIQEIYFSDLDIQTVFKPKKISFKSVGKYSFNNKDFTNIKINSNLAEETENHKIDLDYQDDILLDIINYKKTKNSISNILIDFEKSKNAFTINNLNFTSGNDLISLDKLRFNNGNFLSFKEIKVSTTNNDFFIHNNKKILIKGSKIDATNIAKYLNSSNVNNKFKKINSKIEIDFKNILVPMSERLQNFKLIGEIKKGQFIKITSKGDFGSGNYLDISLKKDENSEKKYLEIYSDLTKPLLTEYSFFKGLSGGKLLYTSIIDGEKTNSKLKIENFKVINAPALIKLLSLADLGGLADLAEGEGLSFDLLMIEMEENKKFIKFNEILALGPSISVLMDGYMDQNNLTSIRGTLVPAKTLNNLISKIPVIGKIVIPKEVGEGLFGISFKIKGPKGKTKTTINPIRTITPRFIQKIIDKNKETK